MGDGYSIVAVASMGSDQIRAQCKHARDYCVPDPQASVDDFGFSCCGGVRPRDWKRTWCDIIVILTRGFGSSIGIELAGLR